MAGLPFPMKPIIQGALDALEGRIRTLETGARSLLTTVTTAVSNISTLTTLLTATSGSLTSLTSLVGSGRLWANRQVLTGAGTYTPTSGTKRVIIRMVGGGGGGGGANSTAGTADSSGAGGNSGWYLEIRSSGSNGVNVTGGSYSCGSGGAGGSTAPGTGGTGGDTTITVNGTTYTAKGGTGGTAFLNDNGAPAAPAACPSTSSADFFCYGAGGCGIATASGGGLAYCGFGGSVPPFGSGGFAVNAGPAQGGPGLGFGAGGAGGVADFFSVNGAAGSAGAIVIDEFF
jgi:hypothetical protein